MDVTQKKLAALSFVFVLMTTGFQSALAQETNSEIPLFEIRGFGLFGPGGAPEFRASLTEEQKDQISELIQEFRERFMGLLTDEQKEMFSQMEQKHEAMDGHRGFRMGGDCQLDELTQEQRQSLFEKMEQLRQEGASREEIRQAREELLSEMGIEN